MKKTFTLSLLILVLSANYLVFGQDLQIRPSKTEKAVYFDVSPPLRSMKIVSPKTPNNEEKEIKNKIGRKDYLGRNSIPFTLSEDPVWQKQAGINQNNQVSVASAPIQNFEGIPNILGYYPPDTQGDVGPDDYIQVVNINFQIFSKTGTSLYGPANLNTIWAGVPAPWDGSGYGDPVVLFDQAANRWMITQFGIRDDLNRYSEMIAISQTSDPTGAWYRYVFDYGTTLPDYPKFGIWPDGYYMSTNQFTNGASWGGVGATAFERTKMLAGDPSALMIYFDLTAASDPWSMLPSDWDGVIAPAAAEPNHFTYYNSWTGPDDYLKIWDFHVDWDTPANSTFGPAASIVTSPFDEELCTATRGQCIPQPGTSIKLEGLNDRLMYRLQYRNFGSYQSMVTNHTVDVDGTGHAGIRWYELRNTGTGWSMYQEGTWAPDASHRWVGSIAMNSVGDIALGYSVSDATTTYPSIRYTGRKPGDPLGTMTIPEQTIIDGTGSQTGTAARWGDYSMMSIDPSDDVSFWFTTEYIKTTGATKWQTRIASFNISNAPLATSAPATDVTTVSATLNGSVNPNGLATDYYFEYGTTMAYGSSTPTISAGSGTTSVPVSASILGLVSGSTYHFRLVAMNVDGTSNSSELTFIPGGAKLTTVVPSAITPYTASSGGEITDDGGFAITERGVCWSVELEPTIVDPHTTDGSGTGSFTSAITGLLPGTHYHVRAYATSSAGTFYGNDHNFTTTSGVGIITTTVPSAITINSAISGGNITLDGGFDITQRGVCWGLTSNPTIADSHTMDGIGTGVFVSSITGLSASTYYHARAYATNSVTTFYGNDQLFSSECVAVNLPFNETFSDAMIPVCWSQVDNKGNGQIWKFGAISGYGTLDPALTGNYAFLNSYEYPTGLGGQNADLISPEMDLTNYTDISLKFNYHFLHYSAVTETGSVSYSIDNGTTWTVISTFITASANPALFSQIIAAVAGQPQVKFKWNYTAAGKRYWFAIDDIQITGTLSPTGSTASILSVNGPSAICNGASTNLAVAITGGTSPYTVIYQDDNVVPNQFTVNSYTSGTDIPVSPTVTTTYSLVSVTDAGSNVGTGNSGTPMITVTNSYDITTSAGTGGTITAGSTVNCGDNTTVTVTPDPCNHIVSVIVDGVAVDLSGNDLNLPFDVDFNNLAANHSVAATFAINTYTITASAGANGSITPAGATSVNCGANQVYTIISSGGFSVQDVLVDGLSVGAVTTYTFSNVTAIHTISATFVAGAYTITASADANGTITPSGAVSVTSGANQAFAIAANACYQIATVLVDGINDPAAVTSGTYTFTNVTAAHTISATFSQLTYTITASAGANGSITPAGATSVNCGANQVYTIIPSGGFSVQDVLVDGLSVGAVTTYTFSNVTTTHTISATFSPIIITCSATGNITYQVWNNIGNSIAVSSLTSNINYPNNPSSTTLITSMEGTTNLGDNYGARIAGYICAPATGSYTFWIASDDNGELWLSTDDQPANKQKIAYITGFTWIQQWNKYPTQKSVSINLVQGHKYYIEALMKEASGIDHLAVGWLKPGQAGTEPSEVIPGSVLSPLGPIQPVLVSSVTLPATSTVYLGSQVLISATVLPANATNKVLNWTTSNPAIAIVNSSGLVTGMGIGQVNIITTSTDGSNTSGTCQVTVYDAPPVCSATGNITYQVWNNIGNSIAVSSLTSNINYPNNPSFTSLITSMEGTTNLGDSYGARIAGYICAPATGSYTFWIASDDNGELWLSTDDQPVNKQKIAYITGFTWIQQWNKYPTQKSVSINLVQGHKYYIEALMKEATGIDNLAVGWLKPGQAGTEPSEVIPGSVLSPLGPIQPVLVSSVTLPATSTVYLGSQVLIPTTVLPANATNKLLTWTTSNPAIAIVNSSGLVTGMGIGQVNITATSTDGSNASGTCQVTVYDAPPVCSATGNITYQVWNNIGNSIAVSSLTSNINYPNNPSSTSLITSMEGTTNLGDSYGARIAGYICAPATGSYTFWIASDDNGELWLSTDDQPVNKQKLAFITGYTWIQQWNKYSTQKSVIINLVQGHKYYIEALMKEATGIDNLAVGWLKPGQSGTEPSEVIPGSVLSPLIIPVKSDEIKIENSLLSDKEIKLLVYPNPLANDVLNIKVDNLTSVATLRIYTISGVQCYEGIIQNSDIIKIDKSVFKSGIYIIRIKNEDVVKTTKLVVN